jgi:transcription elongation factor Elf1
MVKLDVHFPCLRCGGSGKNNEVDERGNLTIDVTCPICSGTGFTAGGYIDITDLVAKIDAIKAMLDSTVYGMEKISSNLDTIIAKYC